MKIVVEIDIPDEVTKGIFNPGSGWFTQVGYINIPYDKLPAKDSNGMITFKYLDPLLKKVDITDLDL